MNDWGETWLWQGRSFSADYSEPYVEAFETRGTQPSLLALVDDDYPFESGQVVTRNSDSLSYRIDDIYRDDDALGAPAWRMMLTRCD